jgi:hypothetical protein
MDPAKPPVPQLWTALNVAIRMGRMHPAHGTTAIGDHGLMEEWVGGLRGVVVAGVWEDRYACEFG